MYYTIVEIEGIVLLVFLLVLVRRKNRREPDELKKITVKDLVLGIVVGLPLVILAVLAVWNALGNAWDKYMTPI